MITSAEETLIGIARTHVGLARDGNEDRVLADNDLGLYAVFDGMGGAQAGEIASSLALEVVHKFVGNNASSLEGDALVIAAIQEAANKVFTEANSRRDRHGMGTTAVVCLVRGDRLCVGHVGDSRAYLLRDGRMTQLTQDHTIAAELYGEGIISAADLEVHPYRNVLSRNLGSKASATVDIRELQVRKGDCLMLCTDGLTGYASREAIRHILASHLDPAESAQELIQAALQGGGGDNIGVVVIRAGQTSHPRITQMIKTTGAVAWTSKRQVFLDATSELQIEELAIHKMLSKLPSLGNIADRIFLAIQDDLERATGVHVWRYGATLSGTWLAQGGDYASLRELLDIIRSAVSEVMASLEQEQSSITPILEAVVIRELMIVEKAVAGVLGEAMRTAERDMFSSYADNSHSGVVQPIAFAEAERTTKRFFLLPEDEELPKRPEYDTLLTVTLDRLKGSTQSPFSKRCVEIAHRVVLGAEQEKAIVELSNELFSSVIMTQSGVASLFEGLDQGRMFHLDAIVQIPNITEEVRTAVVQKVAAAHRSLNCAVSCLIADARLPISARLRSLSEGNAALRAQIDQRESALAMQTNSSHTIIGVGRIGSES